ncbi:hypothetical protein IR148_14050 [Dysgonomonas mossii]|uniref:AbiTii domain-containing protein n=1 Tax=Dysgonomonas mossii TaxID=163665 RepID=A0A4Y9IKX5_9BACT|nr:hypothetical protein [Dysgonomonas mossii]MBF0762159.1 hypothetical protein [Dysgonomonas mossii]TFU87214.1 hypothetical protein E4T88_14035 [Dysgonomonas mossii]
MNILTNIINLLSDDSKPLTSSFLQIKVLASRLQSTQLLEWVNKELSGYNKGDSIPEYRICTSLLMGNNLNGNTECKNHPFALLGLDAKIKDILEHVDFFNGIGALESFVLKNENLQIAVPTEVLELINDLYRQKGNPYFSAYSVYKSVTIDQIKQITTNIRNTALDLILSLENEFGYEIELNELIKKRDEANSIIQNIINNSGNNNIINIGNNNNQKGNL